MDMSAVLWLSVGDLLTLELWSPTGTACVDTAYVMIRFGSGLFPPNERPEESFTDCPAKTKNIIRRKVVAYMCSAQVEIFTDRLRCDGTPYVEKDLS
jgi:hypothetical protein